MIGVMSGTAAHASTRSARGRRRPGRPGAPDLVRTVAVLALTVLLAQCAASSTPERATPPSPTHLGFDYQIGGDYPPPPGVRVVSRDWFSGRPLTGGYSVCYVNAFQTQADEAGVDRPDARSNWPGDLVLRRLGDDPHWGGEYLVDISTAAKRQRAARWVEPMIDRCARKGFDAVELDNLDSWTRFDDTPLAASVPFGPTEATAFATELATMAHARGLAVAQKNTRELLGRRQAIGFDFAVVEECGQQSEPGDDECQAFARAYRDHVLAIEYTAAAFERACTSIGDRASVVRRDVDVSTPGSPDYVYAHC